MALAVPCQGCGFLVLDGPFGTFVICPVCGWEDDNVQAADPQYEDSANGVCLTDHRYSVLCRIPGSVREYGGFLRDRGWLAEVAGIGQNAEPDRRGL